MRRLLAELERPYWLPACLMYGSGLRLMETLRLRVKDLDFTWQTITVREGKGRKDRVVVLPAEVADALREQIARARAAPS